MSIRKQPLALALALAGTLTAASRLPAQEAEAASPLQVHGFFTQGYAVAPDHPILGIDDEPTAEYRAAALQLRYALSESDQALLQFSHRRLGRSILNQTQDDVELDWGFYQKRIGSTSLRLGKIPMPRGLFNEIRDVGTLLPFYRAPYSYYTEGVETIDGALVARSFALPAGFGVDASVFGGGFDFEMLSNAGQRLAYFSNRATNTVGAQLWLSTPMRGLRLGGGAMRFDMDDFVPAGPDEQEDAPGLLTQGSAELKAGRLVLRGEAERYSVGGFQVDAAYAQAGLTLLPRLSAFVQAERNDVEMPLSMGGTVRTHEYAFARDLAASLVYAPSPNVTFKVEAHRAKGFHFDEPINPMGDPLEGDYAIASVSFAF